MKLLRLAPKNTAIPFLSFRKVAFVISTLFGISSVVLLFISGLNFGIDFRGGILIEVRTASETNISLMRASVGDLGLGDVSLQEFGDPRDILIRIEQQPGGEQGQLLATNLIKETIVGAMNASSKLT